MKAARGKIKTVLHNSHPSMVITTEIIVGIALNIMCLAFFIYLHDELLESELQTIDDTISYAVYTVRSPMLTTAMQYITKLGAEGVVFFAFVVSVFLTLKKQLRGAIFFLFLIATGTALNLLLKIIIQRPRPELNPLIYESQFSFPSGHAMGSFVFYASLVYLFYHYSRNTKGSIIVGIIATVLVLLIGFSRIYLGVHYPTDIIAGYAAGAWWFITVLLIDKTLEYYRFLNKRQRK